VHSRRWRANRNLRPVAAPFLRSIRWPRCGYRPSWAAHDLVPGPLGSRDSTVDIGLLGRLQLCPTFGTFGLFHYGLVAWCLQQLLLAQSNQDQEPQKSGALRCTIRGNAVRLSVLAGGGMGSARTLRPPRRRRYGVGTGGDCGTVYEMLTQDMKWIGDEAKIVWKTAPASCGCSVLPSDSGA
jgi:hypothetical protein